MNFPSRCFAWCISGTVWRLYRALGLEIGSRPHRGPGTATGVVGSRPTHWV